MYPGKNTIVLKIGGSLMYNDNLELNFGFLVKLKSWFDKNKASYDKIVIFVGGGKLSRFLGKQVDPYVDDVAEHQIGMQSTIVNAEIVRILLNDPEILTAREFGKGFEMLANEDTKYLVMGGLKSGWSTDMDAAVAADFIGQNRFYKLSNIDHVYTADPKSDPSASIIKEQTWKEYFAQFKIVLGFSEHQPNTHAPIDATCAQFCFTKGISVFVSGGAELDKAENIGSILESGTYIHP